MRNFTILEKGSVDFLKKPVVVQQNARPPRFVYLIEENENVSTVLDEIFKDSYNRWGGLATLIIPVVNGDIDERYIALVRSCDSDVIYTYAELSQATFDHLNHVTKPFLFLKHTTLHSYKPNYEVSFLTSLSLASSVNKLQANPGTKYLLRKHGKAVDDGFIRDNFGFFPLGERLNFVCKKIQEYEPFTLLPTEPLSKSDMDAKGVGCTNATELLERMVTLEICTPDLFSGKGLHSCFTERQPVKIFVGDSLHDRLNFWNARYNYCEERDFSPSCLAMRLPEKLMHDDVFLKAFKKYLFCVGLMNKCQFSSLVSYSLSNEKLKYLQEKLGIRQMCIEESVFPYFPEPMEDQKFYHQQQIHRTETDIHVLEPPYFQHIPSSLQFLKNNAWVVDLEIERHHNLSCVYKEKQTWKLPRNYAIAKNFVPDKIARINASRNISFIKKTHQSLDNQYVEKTTKLTLPSDKAIFNSVFKGKNFCVRNDLRNNKRNVLWEICSSSAAKPLEKTIKAFGSLSNAFLYLDNPLWVEVFRKLKKTLKKKGYISIPKLYQEAEIGDKTHQKTDVNDDLDNLIKLKFLVQDKKIRCDDCKTLNQVEVYVPGKSGQKRTQSCLGCNETLKDLYRFRVRPLIRKSLHTSLHEGWILGKLRMRFSETFFYLLQQDVIYSSDVNDKNEIDIVCVCDGSLVIGEAKTASSQFERKITDKLIKISKLVLPDVIVLAYEREDTDITPAKKTIESAGFKVKVMKIFSKERFDLFE